MRAIDTNVLVRLMTRDDSKQVSRGSQLPVPKKRARPVRLSVHLSIARGRPFGNDS